ncbi:MAG: hypothetical protein IJ087_22665 [Eggerthellaceae bacterium]|nr:hypothetical protein [Eggerthellaceae bacterium]
MDQSYEGFYARFETPSKPVGSMLMGADSLVGDDFKVEFRTEDGRVVAWLRNKFDAEVGFLDVEGSRRLQLANAREQKIRAVLSFVAYSDSPDPGLYWGEVAVFCFNPAYAKEMDAFVDRVRAKMADGVRPDINLRSSGVQKIFDEPGWVPTETVPLPNKAKGMAVLKDHQSMSEKMIEQGRAGNRSCYAVSIVFIVVIVLAVAFGLAKMLGVL